MNNELPYILLADDDPDDMTVFLQAFREMNPRTSVQTVNDGKELIEFLYTCHPDELPALILIDYKMPVISGPEILQLLASNPEYAKIPRVVWSTSERPQDIGNCIRLGAAGYFVKPASSSELDELIRKIELIYSAQLQNYRNKSIQTHWSTIDLSVDNIVQLYDEKFHFVWKDVKGKNELLEKMLAKKMQSSPSNVY